MIVIVIAEGVARSLSTRAAGGAGPIDPRAVDLYLRARAELRRFWGEHVQTASELLEQAAAYAPNAPQILSSLAFASVQTWIRRGNPEALPRALETRSSRPKAPTGFRSSRCSGWRSSP